MNSSQIAGELRAEADRLNQAAIALDGGKKKLSLGRRPRRRLSAAAKRRISEMMKKRWAERKKTAVAGRKGPASVRTIARRSVAS